MSKVSNESMLKAADYSVLLSHQLSSSLPWLHHLRQAALEQFLRAGFPARSQENWKYTDLTALAKHSFTAAQPLAVATVPEIYDGFSHRVVFIDGHFSAALSNIAGLAKNVLLLPLTAALTAHPEKIKPYLQQEFPVEKAALSHLNTALFSDGVVLMVPPNTVITQPLQLLFLSSNTAKVLCAPRNIVVLAENSSVTLLEQHGVLSKQSTPDQLYYKNSLTQITVAKGAKLNLYKIQNEASTTVHTALTDIQQYQDSEVNSYSISLGAKLARDDLDIALLEPGVSCRLRGLYMPRDKQHIDHHTRIDHRSEHGTSDEYYKGILSDHATGVFNGKVIVQPFAQHTQSQQTNKNILLQPTAQMNTKPELEIYADNVQCTHGATVGYIDEEALFYLRSRGLDVDAATTLLTQAFINDVLDQITEPEVAQYLRRFVV